MTGIAWELLPAELGCGSGVTCWRRPREWQAAGVWDRLLRVLLDELGAAGGIDWSRAAVDAGAATLSGMRWPALSRLGNAPNHALTSDIQWDRDWSNLLLVERIVDHHDGAVTLWLNGGSTEVPLTARL